MTPDREVISEIPREIKDLLSFFPLPKTSSSSRRHTKTSKKSQMETRRQLNKSSKALNKARTNKTHTMRTTVQRNIRNVINESFVEFLVTELGRLSPSRQLKAKSRIENVLSQYKEH
uniref:Uncharacterized protein n=1 Tax=Acrobeloides nanus TaxID=290746 RepID=A0A914DPE2_9BILA